MRKEEENIREGQEARIHFDLGLLDTCFIIFTLFITLKPELLLENKFITLQTILCIPLFVSSLFAKSKYITLTKENKLLKNWGFFTFILGYAFLVNIIGIFVSIFISAGMASIFFLVNILFALIYSGIEIKTDNAKFKNRFLKDLLFSALIIFLGWLPAIGVY